MLSLKVHCSLPNNWTKLPNHLVGSVPNNGVFGSSLMSENNSWYLCLCSLILLSKKASESSVCTAATTSSVMSFSSMSISHAGSSSSTSSPTKKDNNRSKLQFSWAFPPHGLYVREKLWHYMRLVCPVSPFVGKLQSGIVQVNLSETLSRYKHSEAMS